MLLYPTLLILTFTSSYHTIRHEADDDHDDDSKIVVAFWFIPKQHKIFLYHGERDRETFAQSES